MNNLKEKLKNHLQNISEDDFRKEWQEIEDLNLQGPTLNEFYNLNNIKFNYFYNGQIISKSEFEKHVPKDWNKQPEILTDGGFSWGYYRAEII